jgi:phytoene/squalene synthetase
LTPELRSLVAFEAERAGALLDAGSSLAAELPGRCRVAVAGFVAGGRSALRGLQRIGYDVSAPRPPRERLTFGVAFAAAVSGR